jgi:hypothetical protein
LSRLAAIFSWNYTNIPWIDANSVTSALAVFCKMKAEDVSSTAKEGKVPSTALII